MLSKYVSLGAVWAFCSQAVVTMPAPSVLSDASSQNSEDRAAAVKEAFQYAWDGYRKYAFPHDELHPVSNGYSDSRNGWGASAVDAFSTALVMENVDVANTILDFIGTINFDVPVQGSQISLFETTIRYLGGLLAGYDLLNGPLSHLTDNKKAVKTVLDQAQHLANNLSFAFNTPSGVPYNNLYFNPPGNDGSTNNGIATIGTLVLEWTRLSDLTGVDTYGKLAQKGESHLLNPTPKSSEPFPGLIGTNVNISNGVFLDAQGGWGGGDDSFYEYLIKMYAYDSVRFESYKDRWVLAADSTIEYLASHPSTRPDLTFTAMYNGQKRIFVSQHLACFNGGNFIFGGLVLKEQKYIDFGLALVHGCEDTYAQTATGIGPEVFRWVTDTTAVNDPNNPPPPANQLAFYEKSGFYISNSAYVLRPEVIESFYYAYRATGNSIYQDWAWNAFVAINSTCRTGSGFAELNNVNVAGGGGYGDFQDSFLFAEVLKYSYLIHSPDNVFQVNHNGVNEFVFNTEAHPVKVAGTPI